jgi:rhodanese-related sulfurtransferase
MNPAKDKQDLRRGRAARVAATAAVVAGAAAAVAFAADAVSFFGVVEISPTDLESSLKEKTGVVLIDVREPAEFSEGHLPGAALMPLGGLPESASSVRRDAAVVTYCRSGYRSKVAAKKLMSAGFTNVKSLSGGIRSWRGALEPAPPPTIRPRR